MSIAETFKRLPKRRLAYYLVLSALFFGIIIVIVVIHMNNVANDTRTYAAIDNYTKMKLPDESRKNVEAQLRNTLKMNYDIPDSEKVVATIREESFNENKYGYSFIVDIEKYQQTYMVTVEKILKEREQESSDGIIISCTEPAVRKWPDVECKAAYNSSTSIELYLPHNSKTANGTYYWASNRQKANHQRYIGLDVEACGNESMVEDAKNDLKDYLKIYNIDADAYEFYVRDLCDGGY